MSSQKIESQEKYDFADIMIKPQYSTLSSRSQVNLERTFTFTNSFMRNREITWTGIPIIAANMDTIGTFDVYKVLSKHKMITAMNKHYTIADYKNAVENAGIILDPDYFMVSTGISDENFANLQEIMLYTQCKWICIDVANGYMDAFVQFSKKVRGYYPDKIIVAGNVVTNEMVRRLYEYAEIDIAKIGIGPGSACLTRRQTGVGIPQISAVMDCVNPNTYIISDGGIKCPGDVAKAFVAGADFVMIGGVFSGHDENPGELLIENGEKYKLFYGMSSKYAMEKYNGHMENYRSSEGAVIKTKYKGALENTVLDYLGGLRSTCTYVGAQNLTELFENAKFVKVYR